MTEMKYLSNTLILAFFILNNMGRIRGYDHQKSKEALDGKSHGELLRKATIQMEAEENRSREIEESSVRVA